jgi:hypothetical protein
MKLSTEERRRKNERNSHNKSATKFIQNKRYIESNTGKSARQLLVNRYLAINIEGKIGQSTVIRTSSFIMHHKKKFLMC